MNLLWKATGFCPDTWQAGEDEAAFSQALGTLPQLQVWLHTALPCPHQHKQLSQKMVLLGREAGTLEWAGHS